MTDDVKLLEERVQRAIDRMGRLRRERDRLQHEVQGLQARGERADRGDSGDGSWTSERDEVVVAVRETLEELCGDDPRVGEVE